jgi:hypothetical protein
VWWIVVVDHRYDKLRVLRSTIANIAELREQHAKVGKVYAELMVEDTEALTRARSHPAKEAQAGFHMYFTTLYRITAQSLDELETVHPAVADVSVITPTEAQATDGAAKAVVLDSVDDGIKLTGGEVGPADLLVPNKAHGYETIPLNLGGFCATSAALDPPLLLPADHRLGKIKYDGRFYGFANRAGAAEFAADPDVHLGEIRSNAKRFPELIELLQLHE